MADATSDAMGAIVPLIGLGIVANMAGNVMRGPPPQRTRTITKTVYRNKPKYHTTKKHIKKRRNAKAPTSFFG
jgi:hypothetical protein